MLRKDENELKEEVAKKSEKKKKKNAKKEEKGSDVKQDATKIEDGIHDSHKEGIKVAQKEAEQKKPFGFQK